MKAKETEQKPEVKAPVRYPAEKLRENCLELFGVTQSTFDGAAYGHSGRYTVSEMNSIIEKWKNKEVR